jgi:hypothetical protein
MESSVNPVTNATYMAQYVLRGVVINVEMFYYESIFRELWYILSACNR